MMCILDKTAALYTVSTAAANMNQLKEKQKITLCSLLKNVS